MSRLRLSRPLPALLLALLASAAPAEPLDPTRAPAERRLAAAAAEAPLPRLQAIVKVDGRYRAVVDGQRLRVGDALGQARVVAIDARSVTLALRGRHERLLLAAPLTPARRATP